MNGLVVYDSYYGNTMRVAEAVAAELVAQGHKVELRSVRRKYPAPAGADFMFLGSPVRMGSVTRRVKKYVKKLDKDAWKGKPLVVFTTILELPEAAPAERVDARDKYDIAAGRKLRDLARSEGLNALEAHLWVDVKGNKGPVVDTGLDAAKQFVRDTVLSL